MQSKSIETEALDIATDDEIAEAIFFEMEEDGTVICETYCHHEQGDIEYVEDLVGAQGDRHIWDGLWVCSQCLHDHHEITGNETVRRKVETSIEGAALLLKHFPEILWTDDKEQVAEIIEFIGTGAASSHRYSPEYLGWLMKEAK